MDTLTYIFEHSGNITWPMVLIVFIWFILKPLVPNIIDWIKELRTTRDEVLYEVETNHLHQMPEVLGALERIEKKMDVLQDIKTGIEIIKVKLNNSK